MFPMREGGDKHALRKPHGNISRDLMDTEGQEDHQTKTNEYKFDEDATLQYRNFYGTKFPRKSELSDPPKQDYLAIMSIFLMQTDGSQRRASQIIKVGFTLHYQGVSSKE